MNSDYEKNKQGQLFFVISGPNMSYNIIKLYIYGFYTQRDFHRVKEHPKRSSDKEIIIIRSWRNFDNISPKTSIFP